MTEPDFMYESLKDDLMIQLYALESGRVDPASVDVTGVNVLAELLAVPGVDKDARATPSRRQSARQNAYGFAATGASSRSHWISAGEGQGSDDPHAVPSATVSCFEASPAGPGDRGLLS